MPSPKTDMLVGDFREAIEKSIRDDNPPEVEESGKALKEHLEELEEKAHNWDLFVEVMQPDTGLLHMLDDEGKTEEGSYWQIDKYCWGALPTEGPKCRTILEALNKAKKR